MKRFLVFLFILFSLSGYSTIYYVKSTGNNSLAGTSDATAWQTLAKVNATSFNAGDQILFNRGDTWSETLIIPSSGAAGNPIVFGAYGTGNKPVITGSDTRTNTITTNNKIYVTIDGFNLVHALGGTFEGSVNLGSTTVQGVIIKNCTIENNRRCGIVFKGTTLAESATVDSCTIQDNGQFGILITTAYTTGQISNCQLLSNGWATVTDASQFSDIQGNLGGINIFGNTIYNAAAQATEATTSHGIYHSTPTVIPVNIHHNIIYGNMKGSGIKIRYSANVYNNVIYGNNIEGINPGGNGTTNAVYNIYNNIMYGSAQGFSCIYEGAKGTGTIALNIFNNTFYKSGNLYNSTKELGIDDNLTSLSIRNNIFYAADGRGGMSIATQANAVIDYNLYWKDTESGVPNNIYNGTTYTTLANWQALGFDIHGVNANPLLVNPTTDFHLLEGSPAINAGVTITTLDPDGTQVDIGAFYFDQSAPDPDATSPTVIAFSVPATYTSLVVPVISFSATDNVGVSGYMISETPGQPTVTDSRWQAHPPVSYSFLSTGNKTLYAWARDAAGNISSALSDQVIVSLPVEPDGLNPGAMNGKVLQFNLKIIKL